MARVLVVGAGGNVGSHITPHLARMPGVSQVILIDRGRYDAANVGAQDIDANDIGRSKAEVQARRLSRINPGLAVTPLSVAVEDVPLGMLRADVIVACLDSRGARVVVNQAAWRLGVPWINAGVDGGGLLARVQTFVPGPNAPCLECAWSQADYDAIEQEYPCQSGLSSPPTNAPSSLGALAAALQAIECEKLLCGDTERTLASRDLMIDARYHRQFVTTFCRNPTCRMPDHDGWCITKLDVPASQVKLRAALVIGGTTPDDAEQVTFDVAGQRIVVTLTCRACGASRQTFRLERALRKAPICRRCRARVRVSGFDLRDAAPVSAAPRPALNWTMSRVGLRSGDVFSLATPSGQKHFEIGGEL